MKWLIFAASIVLLSAVGTARAVATGDPKAGQAVFTQCKACHSLDAGPEASQLIREAGRGRWLK
ncbi:MAG: hypothetical protein JWO51_5099 [Rhodospirillales bacterium]|nr:hypothetical protein [Rhodospirillales bacterium]